MTPQEFMDNFGTLADAPGGLAQLRQMVLALAVQGRLVEQQDGAESSAKALNKLAHERDVAVARGEVDRPSPPRLMEGEDELLPLPAGWAWARLAEAVLTVQIGPFGSLLHQSDYVVGGVPLINPANIRDGGLEPDPRKSVGQNMISRLNSYIMRPGDVVVGRRGEMGKCAVVPADRSAWLCGTGCAFFRTGSALSPEFLTHWFRSPVVRSRLSNDAVGATMSNLNGGILGNLVIGVPPLTEQKRIVAKVDELMALLDDLEAKQGKRQHTVVRATSACLNALTTAGGPEEVADAWKRVAGNWRLLLDSPERIDPIRTSILVLAIRGSLTGSAPQTAAVRADVGPCPAGWAWRRIDEVGELKLGRMRSPEHHHGPHMRPYLRVANVLEARIDTTDVREMNFTPEEAKRYSLEPGDILLNEGQSVELVGRAAIYGGELPGACFQKTLIRFRCGTETIPEFALTVFRAYMRNGRFRRAAVQTTNMAHLPLIRLVGIEFPLPPLPEQKRIVAKVDQLMALCDDLEAKLRRRDDRAGRLVAAVVGEIVGTDRRGELASTQTDAGEGADTSRTSTAREPRARAARGKAVTA